MWVSTFHSFCARLLRREATHLGLPRDFAIFDDDDQTAAVKRALLQLDLPTDDYPPRALRSQISHAKNHGITPEECAPTRIRRGTNSASKPPKSTPPTIRSCARPPLSISTTCFCAPSNSCASRPMCAPLEFTLPIHHGRRISGHQRLAGRARAPAGWHAQERLRRGRRGPVDYGWRGARAGNLKRFTEDFPGAKIIRLEENYRSTQNILDAAAAVVGNNSNRLGKNLQGVIGAGDRLRFYEAQDSVTEAEFICGEISTFLRNEPDAQVAVLYRTGSQSRSFEEILRRMSIRHRVVGGFSFYERAEVRNALAYVRLLFHPEDDVSLLRVLNVPPRGIGAATVALLEPALKKRTSPSGT